MHYVLRNRSESADLEIDILADILPAAWAYWFGGVSAQDVRDALRGAKSAKRIKVNLNTDGGHVTEGLSIYEQLVNHGAFIDVQISAMAASMGSVIAMAGDRITIPETGFVMIHPVKGGGFGTHQDVADMAQFMRDAQDTIGQVYAARTGQTLDQIRAWQARQTYMTAAVALERGFVTEVIPNKAPAATNRAFSMFNHASLQGAPPPELVELIKAARGDGTPEEEPAFDFEAAADLLKRVGAVGANRRAPLKEPPRGAAAPSPNLENAAPVSVAASNAQPKQAEEDTMTIPKSITAALNLVDGADEASVLQAITNLRTAASTATTSLSTATTSLENTKTSLTKIEGLTGKSGEEAVGIVTAWKTDAEKLPAVNKELATLKSERETGELETILNKGREDKKLSKATADMYREQVNKKELSLTALKAIVSTLTPIEHLANNVAPPNDDGKTTRDGELLFNGKSYEDLSNIDRSKLANEDEDKFAAMRKDWEKRGCPNAEEK